MPYKHAQKIYFRHYTSEVSDVVSSLYATRLYIDQVRHAGPIVPMSGPLSAVKKWRMHGNEGLPRLRNRSWVCRRPHRFLFKF